MKLLWFIALQFMQIAIDSAEDCLLGNLYQAISDHHFALLILNQTDCGVRLIFSDEINAKKLNAISFASKSKKKSPYYWTSLYANPQSQLMPIVAIGDDNSHMTCSPRNCTSLVFDVKTSTNYFDCDFENSCTTTFDIKKRYRYINDPLTSEITIIRSWHTVDVGDQIVDEYFRGPGNWQSIADANFSHIHAYAFDTMTKKLYSEQDGSGVISRNMSDLNTTLLLQLSISTGFDRVPDIRIGVNGSLTVSGAFYIAVISGDNMDTAGSGKVIAGRIDGTKQICLARFDQIEHVSPMQLYIGPPIDDPNGQQSPVYELLRKQYPKNRTHVTKLAYGKRRCPLLNSPPNKMEEWDIWYNDWAVSNDDRICNGSPHICTFDGITTLLNLFIDLICVVFVIYFALSKFTEHRTHYKWFTLHIFVTHLLIILKQLVWQAYVILKHMLWRKNPSSLVQTVVGIALYVYYFFGANYFWRLFCMLTAVTLFAMSISVLKPILYGRWFGSAFRWHAYFAMCHVVAITIGVLFQVSKRIGRFTIRIHHSNYTEILFTLLLLFVLFLCSFYAIFAVVSTRRKLKSIESQKARRQLIFMVLYAIIPTIWFIGSYAFETLWLIEYGIGIDFSSSAYSFYLMKRFAIRVGWFCYYTAPISHSIVTLIALRPYRRAIRQIWQKFWKRIFNTNLQRTAIATIE